jgi:uncharacterized membrane protein HdeD (DUF308 family)
MTSTTTNDRAAAGSTAAPFPPCRMSRALITNWWMLASRSLLGVIFGLAVLVFPAGTILALVLLFSAYALVDGVFSIYAAIRASRQGQQWGLLAFQGLASIGAGVIAFLWPTITVLAFVLLIAAWSIVSGVVFVAVAFRVDTSRERWWLMLGGVTSLVFGVLMVLAPLLGALVLTWWLGTYTLVIGVALMVLAFRLRSRGYHRPAGFAPRRAA